MGVTMRTKFGYKITVKRGVNLLTDKIKDYLFNFNPMLWHNDLESYLYFINTKIDDTDVWVQSESINDTTMDMEVSLVK